MARGRESRLDAAAPIAAALLLAALLAACGGSGETAAGRAASTGSEVVTRGPKGERIGGEAASSLHLSRRDCQALRDRAEKQAGRRLSLASEPTPPSSQCRFTGAGATIGVYLDAGHAARQRYLNRMVEQDQFGAPDPGRVTHPVPDVGDPAPGDQNASWVPDLGSLFAVRGNRWITVAYAVDGVPSPVARERAATLALLGFRLSAR